MEGIHINSFTIHRKLPSLNEVIQKNRANRYAGAQFKADIEEAIGWDIKQALTMGTLKPVKEPCDIYIDFFEKSKKRDCDNIISGGCKFILDSMVKQKIITDDGRRWVRQLKCSVCDGEEDFIIVTIKKSET